MKLKQKKSTKTTLSEKIADALTLKPRADIEDDQIFGTKPHTVSRADFSSSESDDEAAISDFRKRNVNLLSEISKKYEGQVISRKDIEIGDDSDSDSEAEDAEDAELKERKIDSSSESRASVNQVKKSTSDSEDFTSDAEESDDYSITKSLKKDSKMGSDDDDDEEDGGDDDGDDDDDDNDSDDDDDNGEEEEGEGIDISEMAEPMKEDFEHVKKQNVSEEVKKGNSVRSQLLLWEGLLEMRIHLQRCMNTANQMPMPNTYEDLKQNNEFVEECITTKANIANVLDKFIALQNILFKRFPETKSLSTKRQEKQPELEKKDESDEEIPSDTDNEEIPSDTDAEEEAIKEQTSSKNDIKNLTAKKRKLEDYEKEIAISHKAFKSFRDSTIQKWNEKTRLAAAANIKNTPTNTILQQISYILSDREKLVRRTQLKRNEYDIVGYEKESSNKLDKDQNGTEFNPLTRNRKDDDEYIPEIFDDSDFYHQLLRELIECKSADITDPVQLSRQWIALQQMRSKMKRKVDTKATKGRKIKYVVHNQLVNYMAPEKCTTWTDESANELYSSLFGKMFEQNNVGLNANLGRDFKIKD